MNKRHIINDILKYYKFRKAYLDDLNGNISTIEPEQVFRETEVAYLDSSNDEEDKIINVEDLDGDIKITERKVYLRELLISQLTDYEAMLVEMRFDKEYAILEILAELFISESTYYRRFREIYNKLDEYFTNFEGLFL